HRNAGRRVFVRVRQPGVKWEERHFYREAEKDPREGEPRDVAREQSVFSEIGERGEIERAAREKNSEEGEQHCDAPRKCVDEKLRCGAVAFFAAPDFDEEERRDEAHLVKQKPENKILRGEGAVERRLHHKHERARATRHALGEKRERKNE